MCGDQQFAVVVLDGRVEHADHVKFPQARFRHPVRVGGRNQHRDRIAQPEPEHLRDATPDDHAIRTGRQVREPAFDDGLGHARHFGFVVGVDAAQSHGQHVRLAHRQCFELDEGRHTRDVRRLAHARGQRIPIPCSARLRQYENARVRGERQQAIAQLAFQPVHHRKNDDERHYTQGYAQQRHPGDEGNEELVGAGRT